MQVYIRTFAPVAGSGGVEIRMKMVAFIHDQAVIDRIHTHLRSPNSKALDPFEARPPSPS